MDHGDEGQRFGMGKKIARYFNRRKMTMKKGSSSRDTGRVVEEEDAAVDPWDFPNAVDMDAHPSLCTDPDTHVTSYVDAEQTVHKWRTRCAHSTALNWWKALRSKTDRSFIRVCELILSTPFGPLINLAWGKHDASIGFALAERWWDTTHTFHFPWGEAGITPLDFTMLTGMSVGVGGIVPFDEGIESFDVAEMYFSSHDVDVGLRLQRNDVQGGGIRCSWFTERYINYLRDLPSDFSIPAIYIDEYVCAFLFFYVGQCFFKTGTNHIRLGWLRCVLDVGVMHTFYWGGAVLAHLYLGLDTGVRPGSRTGSLSGFIVLLPYWWYEYFNTMMPTRDDQDHDIVPRIGGWATDHRCGQWSEVRHNAGLARQKIEMRGPEGVIWQPWIFSKVWDRSRRDIPEAVVTACYRSRDLSLCRTLFTAPDGWQAWFLGDRCWRQTHGVPRIPFPPPNDIRGSNVPMETILEARRTFQWPQAERFLLPDGDYARYWSIVGRGSLVHEDVYRSINFDVVSSHALRPEVHVGRGGHEHEEDVNDPWRYSIYTSHGETTYVPIPPPTESQISDLTQQFEGLDMPTMRSQLIERTARYQTMQQSVLQRSRQSFEDLEAERDRSAQLRAQLDDRQDPRRRQRRRRSVDSRPNYLD